jgi:PAS domain S-box-containing protein
MVRKAASMLRPSNGHRLTVYNVDADLTYRGDVSVALRRAGLDVRELARAAELELSSTMADLILISLGLPDADPAALCRRLKSDPATSPVPVLLLSRNAGDTDVRVAGLEAGADGCLTQPTAAEVVAHATALLRVRRAEQKLLEAADRSVRLQRLSAALSQASTSEQVVAAILTEGMAALGANSGCVAVLEPDWSELVLLGITGVGSEVAEKWQRFSLQADVPLAEAVRERRVVLLESFEERSGRYPQMKGVRPSGQDGAMSALPMVVRGEAIGGVAWGWPQDHHFTDEETSFLLTLAELCGQALDRARLLDAQRVARERAERAEAALRESEERLRLIGDNLPRGAVYQVVGDATGYRRFLHVSAGIESLVGIEAREVLENAWALYALIHEDDRDRVKQSEEDAAQAMVPFDYEFRSWTRKGELIWLHVRSAPRKLGSDDTMWEGLILDVTNRKRTEEALRREQELLETIFARIPVMLTLYEPDTKLLRLNPAFEQATGWTSSEAAGISLMEECYPDPAYRLEVLAFMQSCREGWMDVEMRTRGNQKLQTSWANVRLAGGTHVGIGLDISERKQYEMSLQDTDRRKNEFLAMLAHELRNPLAPLRNGVELLRQLPRESPRAGQVMEMMDRQLAQITTLIDDLLDISRITQGKLRLRRQPIDLASTIWSAVETARPLIDASGHELIVTLPPHPVVVEGDPNRLAQVFANLLTNAAKYTDTNGAISLTVELAEEEVAIRLRDNGIGISAEQMPRLFEMFSQLAPILERSSSGLGIGLALVKGLVEMHGGRVEARSDGVGQGSEFVVRLPLSADTR